jgi:toxin ParE1/3/4
MMLRLAPKALVDLDKIVNYLDQESPSAADGFERRLQELFDALKASPHIGRRSSRRLIRIINTKPYPYLVFYRPGRAEILILRIMHGARNPRSMPARPG